MRISIEKITMGNKIKLLTVIPLILLLNACQTKPPGIYYGNGTIKIRGPYELSDTITISPGTLVKFEIAEEGFYIFMHYVEGKLTIANGGKIIAKGTKDKPIIFECEGTADIIFESSASNESVLDYCNFIEAYLHVYNSSITIRECTQNGNPIPDYPR